MIFKLLTKIPQPWVLRVAAFLVALIVPFLAAAAIVWGTFMMVVDLLRDLWEFLTDELPFTYRRLWSIIRKGDVYA